MVLQNMEMYSPLGIHWLIEKDPHIMVNKSGLTHYRLLRNFHGQGRSHFVHEVLALLLLVYVWQARSVLHMVVFAPSVAAQLIYGTQNPYIVSDRSNYASPQVVMVSSGQPNHIIPYLDVITVSDLFFLLLNKEHIFLLVVTNIVSYMYSTHVHTKW